MCLPLFTGSVLWGHDAFAYFPRLVEVHQNITHGVLLPRWAPDLGRGTGQPLFLFHPPVIYYLGELWHLLGFDFVTAMNLACAVIVLLSAAAMFLLARLYFGDAGGWLGAAAYLYVPYFAVDLYVRSSMEEFAGFPFFALALYGFGAYAKHRRTAHWLAGAAAYACVLFCHFPAALLFTPLLIGFLALTSWMEKSWGVLCRQACGVLLGLGLSASIWVPALASRQHAALDRAVQGNGLYTNHFVYLHQLFYSPWGYGLSVPGPGDGMSFALGWSHLLLAIVVWIWISRKPKLGDRRMFRFFGAAAVLLCILMLQDSLWFWQQLPLLQNVQLPWRLLGPVSICLALHRRAAWPLALPGAALAHRGNDGSHGAAHRTQPVPSAFETVSRCGSYFLDAPTVIPARIRDHHHGGSHASLDGRAARVHSACRHGPFGRRRNPPPGPHAVYLVESRQRQSREHHRNEHRLVSRLGSARGPGSRSPRVPAPPAD